MSLLGVAQRMGVMTSSVEELLAGRVSLSVASKLGVMSSSLEEFIEGTANLGSAQALGVMTSTAQELRDAIGRDGAIGLLIGLCVGVNRQ